VHRRLRYPGRNRERTPDPLFRIGLLCGVRIGESRNRHAGVVDAHDPRIGLELTAEGLGQCHLGDEANVRHSRPIAMAEPAACGMFGEQHLHRAINLQMVVPTLIDGDVKLFQSLAILEYLDEKYPEPSLLPADPVARAWVRGLALINAADSHPLIVPRVRHYLTDVLKVIDEQRLAWVQKLSSREMPFRFSAMRTRKLACER
jgi:hypothetical protein